MMTVQFFSGALLFTLLVGDICSVPVKKGFGPSVSHGSTNVLSSHFAPGRPYNGPPHGVSQPGHQLGPQQEPGYIQPGVQRRPEPSLVLSSSGSAQPGSRVVSYRPNPAITTHSGAAVQPGALEETNWAVSPPDLTFRSKDSVGSRGSEYVSPPLPSGPQFQGGELLHSETTTESGGSISETEKQGRLAPAPPIMPASAGQLIQPQLQSSSGGHFYPNSYMSTWHYPPGIPSGLSHYGGGGYTSFDPISVPNYGVPLTRRPIALPYGNVGAGGSPAVHFAGLMQLGKPGPQPSRSGGFNQGKVSVDVSDPDDMKLSVLMLRFL